MYNTAEGENCGRRNRNIFKPLKAPRALDRGGFGERAQCRGKLQAMKHTKAIARLPGVNFAAGLTTAAGDSRPDIGMALAQHAAYCSALSACGLEVTVMDADENHPDGTFVEDTFVLADGVAVATRPGAKSREGEVAAVAATLRKYISSHEQIRAPGTVDGGDICQADEHFLIGLSARTNEAGAAQLAAILARHGFTASTVDIRRNAALLHLKSGIAYLGERRFVVAPGFPSVLDMAGFEKIEVSAGEGYAANCVRVNDEVLIASGFPKLAASLAGLGYRVRALEMSEFAKMDGGLSCLSLRF
jgi:dimethylargininase